MSASVSDVVTRRLLPRVVVKSSRADGLARLGASARHRLGRRGRVELYFAFDDPWSAVAVLDLAEQLRTRDVLLDLRPIVKRGIPGDPAVDLKRRYALDDARRLAARSGLALAATEPRDPRATGFLAEWVASGTQGPALTRFCVEAVRRLWFESDAAARPRGLRRALARADRGRSGSPGRRRASAPQRAQDVPARHLRRAGRLGARAVVLRARALRPDRRAAGRPGLAGGVVAARVEFFFSFRSPYSYLAGPRAFGLRDRFEIELAFRGVIPMAMRGQSVPRAKRLHTLRDADREAARLGMPFGRIHDPIGAGAMRCLLVAEHARRRRSRARVRARGQPRDLVRGGRRLARRWAAPALRASRARLGRLCRRPRRPGAGGPREGEHRGARAGWATGACRCSRSRASCSGGRTGSTTSRPPCAGRGWSADGGPQANPTSCC